MSAAIELMHVLAKAATALVKLPTSPDHPGMDARMTFTMLALQPQTPENLR